MAGPRSEFVGDTGLSGLPMFKRPSSLTASEKLRLVYTTGTEDPMAPIDNHRAFRGCGRFNTFIPPSRIPPDPDA